MSSERILGYRKAWMVWRTVAAGALLAGVVGLAFSCKEIPRASQMSNPKGQLLKDGELPLLMTRFGEYPKRMVTSEEKLPVRFYFDPALVDLRQVKAYSLWRQDPATKAWRRIGTASYDALPLEMLPEEGLHGLRASVTYRDGTERLVPAPGDEPAMWLCVDRSAPTVAWVTPQTATPVRGGSTIQLEWSTDEIQLGDAPTRLEWSGDRGQTWKPIAQVPPAYGRQRFKWNVPSYAFRDVLVRVVSRDMTGHEGSSVLALGPSSAPDAEAPALAAGAEEFLPEKAVASVPTVAANDVSNSEPPAANVVGASARVADSDGETRPAVAAVPTGAVASASVPGELGGEKSGVKAESRVLTPDASSPDTPSPDAPRSAPRPVAPFEILPFPSRVIAGGSTVEIAWRLAAAPAQTLVTTEWSADGGATWSLVGEAPVEAGKISWKAPARSVSACLVRGRVSLAGGAIIEGASREPFSIDADPPRIALGDVPEVTSAELDFAVAASDPGAAGVARIDAYVRKAGAREWKILDGRATKFEGGSVFLDLSGEDEGAYDLALRAVDRVGNVSAEPDSAEGADAAGAAAIIRFRLDRTPPSIAIRPTPLAWVAGFPADAFVDVDWTDAVPPLVIEGQTADGAWKETGRWASVSPDQNRFSFLIPSGSAKYSVRFSVADQAGNRGQAVLGPHDVEPPLALTTFVEPRMYAARGSEKVLWKLCAAAAAIADELRVSVEHQPRRDAGWQVVYENLPAKGECYWDLPPGDAAEHRLRLRLSRGGKVLGETLSAQFTIGGKDVVAPTVVRIKEDSLFYAEQARSEADKYAAALEAGGTSAEELERLSNSVTAAYEKALSLDANNYHAAYGLAQYLNRRDSEKNAGAVLRWLLRTIEIKPDHFWALNDLGAVYIRDGKFQKAEEALRKCAAMEASPIVLYNLGLALFYGGKMAEARERFESALKTGRGAVAEGEIYYYLVESYLQEGNKERAKGLFREKEASIPPDMRAEIAKTLAI